MIREIKKKMIILRNRAPFSPEIKSYLNQLEAREWVYMNLTLEGSGLVKENIDTVLDGGYILQASVEEHLLIERLGSLRGYLYRLTDMEAALSRNILSDIHGILTGNRGEAFRKTNPVLLEYGYNPMLPAEIPAAVDQLLAYGRHNEQGENVFLKAARIHNRLVEIYPYKEGSPMLARAVMYYYLLEQGYPMAAIAMSEQEYNHALTRYLKDGDCKVLEQSLTEAVLGRLELMIQLTGQEG
jgi:Fic family protein